MNKVKKMFSVLLLAIVSVAAHAQTAADPEAGNIMRSNGRIYVVVAVLLTILLGLFIYLVSLDRKIGKLEKKA